MFFKVGFYWHLYALLKGVFGTTAVFCKSAKMLDCANMTQICDLLGYVLVIIGASLVWGDIGSLAIGA